MDNNKKEFQLLEKIFTTSFFTQCTYWWGKKGGKLIHNLTLIAVKSCLLNDFMSLKHWPQGTKVVILFSTPAVACRDKVKLKRDYELRQHSLLSIFLTAELSFLKAAAVGIEKMGHFPFLLSISLGNEMCHFIETLEIQGVWKSAEQVAFLKTVH